MIGKKIPGYLVLLSLFCFVYNCYLWGGLSATPGVGRRLTQEAHLDSPLAATYLFVGRQAINSLGMKASAADFAAKRFPDIVADPESIDRMPVERVKAAQSVWASFSYLMAPFGLVLSWVLHVVLPKQIRSFGTRD